MPEAARLAVAVLALAAIVGACSRPPAVADTPAGLRSVEVTSSTAAALERMRPLDEEAQAAFAKGDWDGAIALFDRARTALGDDEAAGGWRDQILYNVACAHARAGRAARAAETFAESVAHGLRPIVVRTPAGGWVELPGLSLEHVLFDSDFDTIREEPAYLDALKPFLAAGEPVVEFTRPDADAPVPAVIVLAAEGDDAERALPAWRVAAKAKERGVALVALAGPVRPAPTDRRWILGDGDERWAVGKIREALDLVAKDARIDAKRVFLVGRGARPGEAVWAAAAIDSARLAGFAAPGARFHAAWHADAIAALPVTLRVAIGASDETAATLLKARGIEAVRVAEANDESVTAGALLDAMLGAP